ncbi:uncharacterized protein LOC113039796 isoform X2 [Carassius auratus]|uniref:Uncharacterized protein LOC113039796 isoform X2 n=1 Tax=Carassius auratus TaxID=7957 RepID=A0A6P6J0X4_CARAU|nr:uncharacterized protein LOC113039796 isoform X2 [Carassius auratus]
MNQDKLKTTGVFGVGKDEMKTEEVKTVLGQSETLLSGVEEYHQIIWMFKDRNIAKCRGNTDGTGSCEITDERLRDRLKTDDQTGSLTIINISPELTGLYKLQIINRSSKTSYKQFSVTVSGVFGVGKDEMKTEEVKTALGQSVTLHSGVEEYHQIIWMFEDRNIAKCRGNTDGTGSCEITDERLRDRLKTDDQTGSLTIINISPELTGLYKLQIINRSSKTSSYKQFSVTVSGE